MDSDNTSSPGPDRNPPDDQLSRYQRFTDRLGDHYVLFSHTTDTNRVLYLSHGFELIFGMPIEVATNKHWAEVINWTPESKQDYQHHLSSLIRGDQEFAKFEMSFIHPDESKKHVSVSEYIAIDENGSTVIEGIVEDITSRVEIENTLEHMALFDSLTSLYNRKAIEFALNNEIQRSGRYQHKVSVLLLDLDHFKNINDTYGHQAGDQVLEAFAEVITDSIRGTDSAGRYGGEEFIVLLPETALENAVALAERLRQRVAELRVQSGDNTIKLTTSIGVAVYPDHADSWKSLYPILDKALYAAKHAGRNAVKVATP